MAYQRRAFESLAQAAIATTVPFRALSGGVQAAVFMAIGPRGRKSPRLIAPWRFHNTHIAPLSGRAKCGIVPGLHSPRVSGIRSSNVSVRANGYLAPTGGIHQVTMCVK